MSPRMDPELAARMAVDVVVAYLNRNTIERSELSGLILEVRRALEGPSDGESATLAPAANPWPRPAASPSPVDSEATVVVALPESTVADASATHQDRSGGTPAVPVEDSVTDEYLISLEDGKHFRSLRRHLMAKYGMTPDDYRRKWDLPADYPMVAPSYARERSDVAKRIGLGLPSGRGAKSRRSSPRRH